MRCETTADPAAFWDAASDYLVADPVVNSVIVTNVLGRRAGVVSDPAPATYLTVRDDAGGVVGAAMRTPPFYISLTRLPDAAIAPAVEALRTACPDAGGVAGVDTVADAFATEWTGRTGQVSEVGMRSRIHRLDQVTWPAAISGCARLAGSADVELLTDWRIAFNEEVEPGAGPSRDLTALRELSRRGAELGVTEQRAWLWDDPAPVSFVGATLPAGGIVRVAPVYTPPEQRGRGYASALVAAVSQGALDAGAEACTLYTDITNPTSNKIYAAVGYRPVCDVTACRFVDAG
ncbi:MAG TPA: GNAT family N-acetyltransferase [Actinopolymorphaceae bacterium]|nr:GNAT family N-acetyltransferase [Actinopolymorphaceae bacterium]